MPILASLNAKNRSKSPFSIGMLFSIISDFTVQVTLIIDLTTLKTIVTSSSPVAVGKAISAS